MGQVKLYMYVHRGFPLTGHNSDSILWRKTIETDFLLSVGDRVTLWAYEEDKPYDGPMTEIKTRYWGADGSVHCDLVAFHLVSAEMEDKPHLRWGQDRRPWFERSETCNLEVELANHGWAGAD